MTAKHKAPSPHALDADHKKMKPEPQSHANPQRTPAAPADKQWREHEHHVPTTPGHTQEVAKETGSPELAKHVDKQAKEEVTAPPKYTGIFVSGSEKDDAARQVGYESFAAMVEDSASMDGPHNRLLFVCELDDGRWVRFERESWPEFEAFPSREEAMPDHNA